MSRQWRAALFVTALACAGPAQAVGCVGLNDPDTYVVADPEGAIKDCTLVVQGAGAPRERAIASINRAIAYAARANFGQSENEAADRAAAASDLDQAVRLAPDLAFAHYARAVGRPFRAGDGKAAEFDEAIRLDPNLAPAYLGRANLRLFAGDYERSDADYAAAIRLDPQGGRGYAGRGATRSLTGDLAGALDDLTQALRLSAAERNASIRLREFRGALYFVQGRPDPAIADFSEALRLDPQEADALQLRGLVELTLGSLDLARADLAHACELAPGNTDAALWLEIADRRAHAPGHLAEAAAHLGKSGWPASAVQAFLGEPTPLPMLQEVEADRPFYNPVMQQLRICQAYVFTGELALLNNADANASKAFASADELCPKSAPERGVVAAELKRLSAKP